MRPTIALRMRPTPAFSYRAFQPTARLMNPVPVEDQAAHTVSQRLRKVRKIPAELYPLAAVVFFGLAAASYSIIRKFATDKNLRLKRQGPAGKEQPGSHGEEKAEHH